MRKRKQNKKLDLATVEKVFEILNPIISAIITSVLGPFLLVFLLNRFLV